MLFNVLNIDTQENLKESIEILTSAINAINKSASIIENTLTEKNDKINNTLDNIESISNNLSKVTQDLNEFGISNVLNDIKESAEGINSVIQNLNSESSSLGKLINKDELYETAVGIIKSEGKASTSFLRRKLQIGYNRAARIIDMMEANGEVSKANHVGKRELLK